MEPTQRRYDDETKAVLASIQMMSWKLYNWLKSNCKNLPTIETITAFIKKKFEMHIDEGIIASTNPDDVLLQISEIRQKLNLIPGQSIEAILEVDGCA